MTRRTSAAIVLIVVLGSGCQAPAAGSASGGVSSPSAVTPATLSPASQPSSASPSASESASPSLALELQPADVGGITFEKPVGWTAVGGTAPEAAAVAQALRAAQEAAQTELLAPGVAAADIEALADLSAGALAWEPTSMGVDGALVITVLPNEMMSEADRSLQSLQGVVTSQLDTMDPTERSGPETSDVPLGESVRASATMPSGHVVHRAAIAGSTAVYMVLFVTKLTADESDPVFEAILASIEEG